MNKLQNTTLYLIRHAETTWSSTGQHTGITDLPLTPSGVIQAKKLKSRLNDYRFSEVYSSPLQRARKTAELAGYHPTITPDLTEWNYGTYEGKTTEEIQQKDPHWNLFVDGAPGGETPAQVKARAQHLLSILKPGHIALFGSAHILRVIAACFLNLPLKDAAEIFLSPASISILGHEHDQPSILLWNDIEK
ncbi:MAG: histidine phosphatase family protein [Verrucomicrobia bacterium]|nr:histidine phosphatase family protein [Verrucomicrobiota bacterium]